MRRHLWMVSEGFVCPRATVAPSIVVTTINTQVRIVMESVHARTCSPERTANKRVPAPRGNAFRPSAPFCHGPSGSRLSSNLRRTYGTRAGRSGSHLGEIFEAEAARVDGHAQGAVDAESGQLADFIEGRDAPGRRQFVRSRGPQAPEPLEIGAFERPLAVDIGAEES